MAKQRSITLVVGVPNIADRWRKIIRETIEKEYDDYKVSVYHTDSHKITFSAMYEASREDVDFDKLESLILGVIMKEVVSLSRLSKKKLRKMNCAMERTYQGSELKRHELVFQIVFGRDA